jgi:hypothetical protein
MVKIGGNAINITKMNYTLQKIINRTLKGQKVRDWMAWGTYGKTGNEPLRFVLLKNMSDEHIQAILDTQFHITGFYRREFKRELKLRKRNPKFSLKETL